MIHVKELRRNKDQFKERILSKDPKFPFDDFCNLDSDIYLLTQKQEELRQRKNFLSKDPLVARLDKTREEVKLIKKEESALSQELESKQKTYDDLLLRIPNIPHESVPVGDATKNQLIRQWGNKPSFDFEVQDHVALMSSNLFASFEKGSSIAKSGFVVYEEKGAELLYQLVHWILDHNKSYGYSVCIPPVLVNEETMTAAGNLPRFKEDAFVCEKDNLYLLPTSEVAFVGLFSNTIFFEKELPLRKTAWTSCFRREAGGYGASERGMIRLHQFDKIELFAVSTPDQAASEHEHMLECSESILKKLGLAYQAVLLSTGDIGFSSAKTYDLEVWMPGLSMYREVASISTCTDFQARRAQIRFRNNETQKTQLVHTLNGSALGLSRLLVALVETYQTKNGKIDYQYIKSLLK